MSTTRRTFLRTAAAAVFGTLAAFYAPMLASIDDGWEDQSIPGWVGWSKGSPEVSRDDLTALMRKLMVPHPRPPWFKEPLKENQP